MGGAYWTNFTACIQFDGCGTFFLGLVRRFSQDNHSGGLRACDDLANCLLFVLLVILKQILYDLLVPQLHVERVGQELL